MSDTKGYVNNFGHLSFEEKPFCDADAITLCEALYFPVEQVVSDSFDDEPRRFQDVGNELFALRGNKHKPMGLLISSTVSKRFMTMTETKRFSDLKFIGVKEVYCADPAIQFCGITLILPDGTLFINFRGTDDTIAGWKEDVDFFLNKTSPSNKLAVDYIETVSSKFEGNIIVAGHSKGGNLALRAAIECSSETRKKIVGVYNFDGPGYPNHRIFNTGAYDELLPVYRHYIPYSSLIGVLLAHDYDYKVVDNKMHTGPMQHNIGVWILDENGEMSILPDTDFKSKVCDILFSKICERASEEVCVNLEEILTKFCLGLGQKDLMSVSKHLISSVTGAIKANGTISSQAKKSVNAFIIGSKGIIKEAVNLVKKGNVPSVTENAFASIAE